MRILQIAPLWETVPPPAYGGTEAVVSLVTEELVARGHDVTLAASGDSRTSATLLSVFDRSLRRADDLKDRHPYEWVHIAEAICASQDFDVIHNHAGEPAMAFAGLSRTPMLTTVHCLTTPDTRFVWERYTGAYNTISRAQRRHFKDYAGPGRYAGHVYNGIDHASFPFQETKDDYLLFLSRIAPEKGPVDAIEVARRLGMQLILAGKVDAYDQAYYDGVVRPLIDGDQVTFIGEADGNEKRDLYRNARCVLMPLAWEEPFGLVMAEAMACGTPVIAFRRGSAPELIVDGVTGFIVDTVDEMAEAVTRLDTIDPRACRAHVAERFSVDAMVDNYLRVYEWLLDRPRRRGSIEGDETVAAKLRDGDPGEIVAVA
jgi:glycosyltransferase involved in cell wall biosynthesis